MIAVKVIFLHTRWRTSQSLFGDSPIELAAKRNIWIYTEAFKKDVVLDVCVFAYMGLYLHGSPVKEFLYTSIWTCLWTLGGLTAEISRYPTCIYEALLVLKYIDDYLQQILSNR